MDRVRASTDRTAVVHLITGFLGSGKTSLLQRYLSESGDDATAVLINEFGSVGLDHHLVVAGDASIQVLENGCLCCAVAGRLRETLRTLIASRKRPGVTPLRRIVIETSGLAYPEPILNTIRSDYALNEYLRIGAVTSTLDAMTGTDSLARFPEVARQICAANRILVTKSDLAAPTVTANLIKRVRKLNPLATIEDANGVEFLPSRIFDVDADAPIGAGHDARQLQHAKYRTFALTYPCPLDWARFSIWLTALLNRHGRGILRFKAILELQGRSRPVVIQAVQHLMYPPRHLERMPEGQKGSQMVFIVEDVDPQAIVRSLDRFMAEPAVSGTE